MKGQSSKNSGGTGNETKGKSRWTIGPPKYMPPKQSDKSDMESGQSHGSPILRNLWVPPVSITQSDQLKGIGYSIQQGQAARGNPAFGIIKKQQSITSTQLRQSLPMTQMFESKKQEARLAGYFHLRGNMGPGHDYYARGNPQLTPIAGYANAHDLPNNSMMLTGIRIGNAKVQKYSNLELS